MKNLYLAVAVIGTVVQYVFFAQHVGQIGFDFLTFINALLVNPAAAGFTLDLAISSLVFWIAIICRHRIGKGPKPLLFLVRKPTFGVSCGLPAYLFANEKMQEARTVGVPERD